MFEDNSKVEIFLDLKKKVENFVKSLIISIRNGAKESFFYLISYANARNKKKKKRISVKINMD